MTPPSSHDTTRLPEWTCMMVCGYEGSVFDSCFVLFSFLFLFLFSSRLVVILASPSYLFPMTTLVSLFLVVCVSLFCLRLLCFEEEL